MMKKLLCTLLFIVLAVGFVQAQEIDVLGNGISIPGDASNTPSTADGTDFGQIIPGSSSAEQLFTIENTGAAPLTILGSFIVNSGNFTITTLPSAAVPSGGSTTIGVTFNAPVTEGIYTGQLLIFNTDSDEGQYLFNISGESLAPVAPEIDVLGNGISIVGDGTNTPNTADGTDFGQITPGTSSSEQLYVIENTGTQTLNITGTFMAGSSDFVITTSPATSVAPGGTTTIGVTFNAPVLLGTYTGQLLIANDDADEGTYIINITGESAAPAAPEIDVLGNGISIVGDGSNTPNTADGTDFGQVTPGTSSAEQLFVIENTGTQDLTISGSFIVGSSNFVITTSPATTIAPGGSTSIGVTFNAPVTPGVYSGELLVINNDSDEGIYEINLSGESAAPAAPEIDVLGNGISIVGDGTNTPNTTDGTDFGQVASNTSSAEQLFTIANTGTEILNITGSFIVGSSDFVITTSPAATVAAGSSTTIGITFNAPATAGVYTGQILILNNDPDESNYQINVQAESIDNIPEMDVFDNASQPVANGSTVNVGQTDVTFGTIVYTFTIENTGIADLILDGSPIVSVNGPNSSDFTVTSFPSSPVASGGSTTFEITFDPSALGTRVASISIDNNDSDEDPYEIIIQGEGIDANADTPLLITQYYEGTGSDQWIEVKNISQQTVIAGNYVLALYTNFNTLTGTINTVPPNESISIGTMAPGAVRIFRNPAASLPGGGNLGSAPVTTTSVCTFDGNDVILISTTADANCYDNRIDIMGVVDAVTPRTWGQDTSFIKGCGTNEQPSTTFDATLNQPNPGDVLVNDYIELTLDEVNIADPATNIALGTQGIGTTVWTTTWSNEKPDRTRDTRIEGTYLGSDGSFETCNFTINGTLNFNSGTANYISVHEDLTINGTFTIGDTEALHFGTDNEDAIITGVVTKIESSTSLVNINDFTYWSSPVVGATIETVFSNANLDRVYYWDQSADNLFDGGDVGDSQVLYGEWINASGAMRVAKGYISEGPTSGTYPQQHTLSFTGVPHNGVLSIAGLPHMVFNNDGNAYSDYNLVGNPYPSAIDADLLIGLTDNNTIDGTLWFWTHNTQNNGDAIYQYTTDDYASYNLTGGTAAATGGDVPTGSVGSAQGFMVRAISDSPGLIFNNEMRLKGENTQFFRGVETKSSLAEEKDRVWLNVESSEGGAFNQILIGFMENATDGHDRGYDGIKNGASWVSFYSKIDTARYAIQGLGSFNLDKKVKLGFDTYIDQPLSYTISIANIEGVLKDNDLYLVDHMLGVTHDLKQAPYTFDTAGVGYFDERFTLQFTKSTLSVEELNLSENDFVIVNNENSVTIKSNTIITKLKVYDMMGRLLLDKEPNDSNFDVPTPNIRKGTVLILNATFDNGAEASKKAIKY